jgi:hypothetical protein
MSTNNRDISSLRLWIVKRRVLLDGEVQHFLILMKCRIRIASNVLAWDRMLLYAIK